jgi:hypothetical protein
VRVERGGRAREQLRHFSPGERPAGAGAGSRALSR